MKLEAVFNDHEINCWSTFSFIRHGKLRVGLQEHNSLNRITSICWRCITISFVCDVLLNVSTTPTPMTINLLYTTTHADSISAELMARHILDTSTIFVKLKLYSCNPHTLIISLISETQAPAICSHTRKIQTTGHHVGLKHCCF